MSRMHEPAPPHTRGTKEDADAMTVLMPVGTMVRYYPGPRSYGFRETTIRAPFMVDVNGLVVGWVEDQAGYVSVDHIEKV